MVLLIVITEAKRLRKPLKKKLHMKKPHIHQISIYSVTECILIEKRLHDLVVRIK